jgi:hypothetical protein
MSREPLYLICGTLLVSGAIVLSGCMRAADPPPASPPCPHVPPPSPVRVPKIEESRAAPAVPPPTPGPVQAPGFRETRNLSLYIGDHQLEVFEGGVGSDITLDGKVIMHHDLNDDRPEPGPWADLYRYFGPMPPFAGVVLLAWRAPGNACFGPDGLTFVSVRDDGTWERADVPYCAGPPPVITWTPASITVRIPPHPPNRGTGTIPGETWVYSSGVVSKSHK